jgi:hypothetical protein
MWVLLITKYCDGPKIRALLQINRYLWNLFNKSSRRSLMMRRGWRFGLTHQEEISQRLKEFEYYYRKETNNTSSIPVDIIICKCCYYTSLSWGPCYDHICMICFRKLVNDPPSLSWLSRILKWIKG